jgi:hypothetical protein
VEGCGTNAGIDRRADLFALIDHQAQIRVREKIQILRLAGRDRNRSAGGFEHTAVCAVIRERHRASGAGRGR